MSATDLQPRLDELESRLAFQDDLIERLNEVVSRQDRELAALMKRLADLEARLQDLGESIGAQASAGGHEVPPHY